MTRQRALASLSASFEDANKAKRWDYRGGSLCPVDPVARLRELAQQANPSFGGCLVVW